MPDDRNEIGRCLEKSDKEEIDKCEPGLSRVLEGVVQGQKEILVIDILFPKYALPDNIVKPVKECLLQTVCQLENFCGDLSEAMVNVLMNKSLTFPIEQKSECIESNYNSILKKCPPEGANLTEKLLQSVKRAYNKLEKLNVRNLPSKRPYNLPGELFRTINSCLEKIDLVSFEKCCPGITDVLRAYQKEKPIPAKFVTSRTCKYECISYATSSCAKPDASQLQSFIALTMKMYENIPSSLELLDEIASSVKITVKDGLVSIPSDQIKVIKECQDKISPNLNLCCPKLNQIVTNTLNTNQITAKKEDLK
ncbi:uncharacterized protein TNCV_3551041 [Trichonephila clavipes]|nr:uncharacterized protein TNCV_3551041 [Trichonephila clavipes]